MHDSSYHRVTRLLTEVASGHRIASDELLPLVYGELRRLAQVKMARERPGQTLQATALVHEAYIRLLGTEDPGWENRGHFFAAAAEAMRRILIERARQKASLKRGGDVPKVAFDEMLVGGEPLPEQLLALDEALDRLEARDASMAQVVKLRYFAGLSVKETANAMDVSPRTVNLRWAAARAWLLVEMEGAAASGVSRAAEPAAEE